VPDRSWNLLGSRPISDHGIFQLRYDRYRLDPSGAEKDFVVLQAPDWVNVVPLTDDGQVVLVRQYRHGIRCATLEIPGGMIDPPESPAEAARRELAEETGYVPARLAALGRVSPNPAMQDNSLHLFVAEGCRLEVPPQPDPFERIEVVLRPVAEIPELIRREEICNAMVVNAFGFLGLVPRTKY